MSVTAEVKVKEEVTEEEPACTSKIEEDNKPDINDLKEKENMDVKSKMSALSALTQPLKESQNQVCTAHS